MKLASIEKIISIKPIDQADQIELAQVLGWEVVVRKNEFAPGDWCVYIPIDTVVNSKTKGFESYTNPRIKTKFIRGVWSQGLVVSIGSLDDSIQEQINGNLSEGADVGELLGITKYEKASIGDQGSGSGSFPSHIISRTDEDNLRSKPNCLNELDTKSIYLTKKMDGSSLTIIYGSDGAITVCSRNLTITDPTNPMYKYVLDNKLDKLGLKSLAIQGEFCGPKINGNKLNLKSFQFYVFNVKDLENSAIGFYGLDKLNQFVETYKLQMVPVLAQFVCDKSTHTIQWFQNFANGVTYSDTKPGEGIVIRPCEPTYSSTLGKNLSCKVINQLYKD